MENQLQVAFATIAEQREQIDSLSRVNWSLEERLRHDAESREKMKSFYENQMEDLRKDQQKLIEEAASRITKSFQEQIAKLTSERDAALLAAKHQRGKRFGSKSECDKGDGNA